LSLRARIVSVVAATLLILFSVLYFASSAVLVDGFLKLENLELQRQIYRGQAAVKSLLAAIELHAQDWSNWDDTYAFLKDGNEDYIRSNLATETFTNLDFDLFFYFNRDGSLFAGFQYDGEGAVVAPSRTFVASIYENRQFVEVSEAEPLVSGVILVEGRPMLVASAAILTSERKGPSRGTLMIGRYLTQDRLQEVAKTAGLSLSFVSPGETSLALTAANPTMVRVDGQDTIAGYFLLTDAMGKKVATIRIDAKRWIYRQGKASQSYLLVNLVAVGAVFVVLLVVLLHRLVLSRLARLDRGVGQIRQGEGLTVRLPVEGNDELSSLASTINETLEALQQTQHTLRHDALHDPLTGLANRALFFQKMDAAMVRQKEDPLAIFALLLIDIDHFKLINDSFGHGAGDKVLMLTGQRLCQFFRAGDTVGRLGGDEFAVLLEPLKEESAALQLARDFLTTLHQPVSWEGHLLHLGASIGVVCSFQDSSPEQLMNYADTAMYHAKREGRNCVALFDKSMGKKIQSQLALQNELRGAVARGELSVCYQPIMVLGTDRLYGLEALVRWQHPAHGTLVPDQFIPLAESGGFIAEIDTWVFREATRCMLRWQELFRFATPLHVSVNLSCTHAQLLDVVPELCRILSETGLDGRFVGLEITEGALMAADKALVEQLHDLKALGVRLYMDDFGRGHFSLSRLHQLPIDVLKVDCLFIPEVDTGNGDISRTIMTLAHGLGMQVVAEGIENPTQLAKLKDSGCDFGQGYLFAKPLTEENATAMLQDLHAAAKDVSGNVREPSCFFPGGRE